MQRATVFLFVLIATAASLALFLAMYGALRIDASLGSLVANTIDDPLYFWLYVGMTLAAIVLFGINAALFAYRWRKYGRPRLVLQGGSGLAGLIGIAASACPVCGSTILAAIGIVGGLSTLPFHGLELKTASLLLMALSTWLLVHDVRRFSCRPELCPMPRDPGFKKRDTPVLIALVVAVVLEVLVGGTMLWTDRALARQCRITSLPTNYSTNAYTQEVF